jgi:hypothetical protein
MPNLLTDVDAPAVLLAVGAVLTLASLCTHSGPRLAAGVVLLVIALLGPGATRLSIRLAPVDLTLERQLPREHGRAPTSSSAPQRRWSGPVENGVDDDGLRRVLDDGGSPKTSILVVETTPASRTGDQAGPGGKPSHGG